MIDLSIIILSYNTRDLLEICLNSIFTNTKNLNFEVIVIDNASTDGSVDLVRKKYPQVFLLKSKKNLGYSAGNNFGIRNAKGKYILLLNSDTQIIGESLSIMVKFLREHKDIDILGPKIVNPDHSSQNSVGIFYSLPRVIMALFGGERLGFGRRSPEKFSYVDWISGACFLVKRTVFNDIGYLDENLFMYMEEVEFCYRARQNGVFTAFLPEARIVHQERGSSISGKTQAVVNIYKGLLYFYSKYYPNWQYQALRLVLWTKASLIYFLGKIVKNQYFVTTYGQALKLF